MAELEFHHKDHGDPIGKKVGVQAAVLAVLLAVVTIASHRAHTAAIIHKSTANDQWAYYQATRIKLHNAELAQNLIHLTIAQPKETAEKILAEYEKDQK